MQHSFLFAEGDWEVSGTHIAADGSVASATGVAQVRREADAWVQTGRLTLVESVGDGPSTVENCYRFRPLGTGELQTSWRCEHRALGELSGLLVVVNDALLLTFQSADGRHWGTETLLQVAEGRYLARGAAFSGEERTGAWALDLRRRPG